VVVSGGVPAKRTVELGARGKFLVEIRRGLEAGERVVIGG